MTFRMRTPGVFRCDTWGCPTKVIGYLEEVPEGWETRVGYFQTEDAVTERVEHVCPSCAAKEPK